MKTTRRQVITLGAGAAAVSLLSGCESLEQHFTKSNLPKDALPPQGIDPSPVARLLNRMAYGPRPGDIARVEKIGIPAYIEEQLHPESIAEPDILTWRVRSLGDMLTTDTGVLFDEDDRKLISALRQATILRAVYSERQLHERMAEFWSDHFNIYAFKGDGRQFKIIDDAVTIRKHVLGTFRELLGASARSAAMLGYLDNTSNKKGVPNENYARELMELHTLGVHGGYTQHDVKEVARCLTGWTAEQHWHRGRFEFDPKKHDTGAKRVLGVIIPAGGGLSDGEKVLDIVAAHPSTAQHLSRKLCIRFLGHAPDTWVSRLADIYQNTQGDIKAMLRPLLNSSDLLGAPPILKRPLDYAASALRAYNADTDGGADVQSHLEKMGQPLFAWPMPDGFPEQARAWTGAMIPRWNFALELTGGKIANTSVDWKALERLGSAPHDTFLELAFGERPESDGLRDLRARQSRYPEGRQYAALLLLSPQFQWR